MSNKIFYLIEIPDNLIIIIKYENMGLRLVSLKRVISSGKAHKKLRKSTLFWVFKSKAFL